MLKQYDVVITKRVIAGEWGTLRAGSKGTIIEVYKSAKKTGYEVEFVTPTGRTKALVTLSAEDIQSAMKIEVAQALVHKKVKVASASSQKVDQPKTDSKVDRAATSSKRKVPISKKVAVVKAKVSKGKRSVSK